jgi:hypothetical protein
MILYHFTCVEYLPSIMANGLNRGDVPFDPNLPGRNGVWLTTGDTPVGHGLGQKGGSILTDPERAYFSRINGHAIPPGARFPNKHAVRIKAMIPSSDRRLVPWWKWGRKHCQPDFFDALNAAAPNWRSAYIYWGVITPERFSEVSGQVGARPGNIALNGSPLMMAGAR